LTTVLAIETSCDETSVAVVRDGVVLANPVASQIRLHAEYGGVVPELATREHLRNLPALLPRALAEAGVAMAGIDAIAATAGPGLPNALLTGLKAAQGLAFALNQPCYGVHHHEGHLYSPWLTGAPLQLRPEELEPHLCLIVSGGHTLLIHVRAEFDYRILGSTIDDAAGECFDKTAKLMGLPYPGGPELDRLAEHGNASAYRFPRPLLSDPGHDFSFSGLKTSVRYFLRDHPEVLEVTQTRRDLAASVQAAITDVLIAKTLRAARAMGVRCITAAGGVACNRSLRAGLAAACAKHRLALRLAQPQLCTDNAAMVGIVAWRRHLLQHPPISLDDEPHPSWPLGEDLAA
jgi:N6-L-threonylcarbamoyladenine synthase